MGEPSMTPPDAPDIAVGNSGRLVQVLFEVKSTTWASDDAPAATRISLPENCIYQLLSN